MTARSQGLRDRLLATAADYRHTREEHRRARLGGHTRRRLESRLAELSTTFERLLAASALDESTRAAWRRHLYHLGLEPDLPVAESLPAAPHRPPRTRDRGKAPLWQR